MRGLSTQPIIRATLLTIELTAVDANGTQYTTSDNLGSPRVITKAVRIVASRHDYQPFGTELGAGVGGRTKAWNRYDRYGNRSWSYKARQAISERLQGAA